MLLSRVHSLNSIKFPKDGFGVSYHTASSEPWFYDTAYNLVKHQGAIPVYDVLGVCFIAKLAKGGEQRSPAQVRPDKAQHKCKKKRCPKCGEKFDRELKIEHNHSYKIVHENCCKKIRNKRKCGDHKKT